MTIDPKKPKPLKERSTRELFQDTLEGDYDDEGPWNAVQELHKRSTPEVFQIAVEFCNSTNALRRERGVDVMGQFGQKYPHDGRELLFFDERVSFAMKLLKDEEPRVVSSAAWALAHLNGDRAITALIGVRNNPDPLVRHAVAYGLGSTGRPEAIETLIELMEDTDDDVRDWATFGLGVTTGDSTQIREAFRRNLNDTYLDVRQEATWGLARRKDPQGLRLLLEQLEADVWAAGDEWAACEILGLRHDTPVEDLCKGLRQILDLRII